MTVTDVRVAARSKRRPTVTGTPPPPRPFEPPASGTPGRLRRSPRLIVIGVLLACLGALIGALAFSKATETHAVVVMSRTVPRGAMVQTSDLAVSRIVDSPGVRSIPSAELSSLVGQRALVDLPQGSLVVPGAVGQPHLPPGTSEIGLKLSAGRLPSDAMPAGTPVQLFAVSGAKSDESTPAMSVNATVVTAPRALPDGADWVVDVAVPDTDAQQVADLASRDQLALVRESGK